MKNAKMLCLGMKKILSSPRYELTTQGGDVQKLSAKTTRLSRHPSSYFTLKFVYDIGSWVEFYMP